jgi:hypothetical protein
MNRLLYTSTKSLLRPFNTPKGYRKFSHSSSGRLSRLVPRSKTTVLVVSTGASGFYIVSNIAYAVMRAKNDPKNDSWRNVTFFCGFPATACSYLLVDEGSNKAYGVKLDPR